MLIELFVSNLASTIVTSGGMSVPESGAIETLTVSEADGIFPVVSRGVAQFHFKDRNPECSGEIFRCIETNGPNWTVIRGAENTKPVAHGRKFTIRQVTTSEFFQRLGGGSTTDIVNAVTVCGADNTGSIPASNAIMRAASIGPAYLPSGFYTLDRTLNLHSGSVLFSFGHAVLTPTHNFMGDAAIALLDGPNSSRLENLWLNGGALGAGTKVYGVYARTNSLEAELRTMRIQGFPNSGIVAAGTNWHFDRVTCHGNFGHGFELDVEDSLFIGCRATANAKYGFIGSYDRKLFFGCLARDNQLGDYQP